MRGQDFNGEGICGIVKILMAARGMRLPEIKETFGSYLTDNVVYSPDWKTSKGINLNTIPVQSYTNGVEPVESEKVRIDINTEHNGNGTISVVTAKPLVTVRRYAIDGKKRVQALIPGVRYPKAPEVRLLYNIPNILNEQRVVWVEGESAPKH